jgi:hypothetical protein
MQLEVEQMKATRRDTAVDLTIHARSLGELFSEREFDPFVDETGALWSIAQIAKLPDATPSFAKMRLRVLLPAEEVSPETQTCVEQAIARYCSHKLAEARLQMAAWRHVATSTFLWGLAFFALSLLVTAGLQKMEVLPDAIRTLGVETLVIAGWVIMWQPMDTLIQGWLPIRQQERTFRAIDSMPATVEAAGEERRVDQRTAHR